MQTEERVEYRKKHPEIEEVKRIIEEIDRNNIPAHLKNARKIKEWMEKNNTTMPPSTRKKCNRRRKKRRRKVRNNNIT